MSIIQELIEATNLAKTASSALSEIKLKAIKYLKSSGYQKIESCGYTVSLKETKRSTITESADIQAIETRLHLIKAELAETHSDEIYKLQQEIREKQYLIHKLVNNEETECLRRLLEAASQELKDSGESKFDVVIKFDAKSPALFKYISKREFRDLVIEGKKLKQVCGKSLTETEIARFIMAWAHDNKKPGLQEAWQSRVSQHINYCNLG